MQCLDDFRLSFKGRDFLPLMVGGMGTNISTTLTGIAQTILYYESPHSLAGLFPALID